MRTSAVVTAVLLGSLLAGCAGAEPNDTAGRERPSATAAPVPAQACDTSALPPGTSEQVITVGGAIRRYLLVVPDDPPQRRLPVVEVLHGLGGDPLSMLAYTGWAQVATDHQALVVAPAAEGERRSWDFTSTIDDPASDAAFLAAVFEAVSTQYCGDPARQYVSGISNGSAMVFALACSGRVPIQAYGGVAAIGYLPRCSMAPPASIVYFHGTDDRVVPYAGGTTPIGPADGVEDSLARWAAHDGCRSQPAESTVADDVRLRTWAACDGSRLEAYIVDGGGHTWPGAFPLPGLGTTTRAIDATEIQVEFFGLD